MDVKKVLILLFITVFLGLSPTALLGQVVEPSQGTEVEPIELSPSWWNQLVANPEKLEENFDQMIKKVEPLAETLTEKNRKKAESLVSDIKLNLKTYLKTVNQPLPPQPVPGTIADTYSVDELINLNNSLLKTKIALSARKEEQKELQKTVETLQERTDFVWKQYSGSGARSEERVLYGLEVISLLPAVNTSKKKLQILDKSIRNLTQTLQFIKEEIDTAENRLKITSAEQTQLARQIDPSARLWQDAKSQTQRKEKELSGKFLEGTTEKAKLANQHLHQLQLTADLKEIEAHNRLVRAEILYTLANVLNEPDKVNTEAVNLSLVDWATLLSSFRASTAEWESQTRRAVNRSSQLLSLGEQRPDGPKTEDIEKLREIIEHGQQILLNIQTVEKKIDETTFLYSVLEERFGGFQGPGQRWLKIVADFVYNSLIAVKDTLGTTLFHIGVHPVTPLLIARFVLIMIFTWWVARVLSATLNTVARGRKGIRKSVIYRINTLFRYMILLIGLLVALTSIGFDFSNLVLIAGALGIGLGFGLQNIFNNFISGVIILFQSHLKVGDFIELDSGLRGEIREINVRSTVITTNDGVDVIVPNSEMTSSRIVNWTLRDPYRRVHIPFSVAYGSDIDEVAKVVKAAAKKIPSTLQKIGVREPQVYLQKFGDSALEMELVVWVNEKWTRRHRRTLSEYLWGIEKALKKHGFVIPFPQRDLHIKDVEGRQKFTELDR